MEKLKLKVTVAFESYISMVNDYMCILCKIATLRLLGTLDEDVVVSYRSQCQEGKEPNCFCDQMNNHPTTGIKTLGDLVVRHISSTMCDHCIINDERHHVLHILTQPNGTDCGFYVMLTIWMMVEEFIQGYDSADFVS